MNRRLTILVTGLFFSFSAYAENGWYSGVVVLKDDQVLVGDLRHHSQHNIVQIKVEDEIKAFSAFAVNSFHFHDTDLGFVRRFISVPFEEGNKRFSDAFFELIIRGEVSLVRKEKPFSGDRWETSDEVYNVNGYAIEDFQYQHAMSFDYFFLVDGKVVHSDRFKRIVLPHLESWSKGAVKEFVDDNTLNAHKIYDQVLIIRYFNKISDEDSYLSSM